MHETIGATPPAATSIRERPWHATPEEEERDQHWADYAAWERWMGRNLDDALPEGEPSFMEGADPLHKAYLYNLMARIADGDAPHDLR